MFVNLFLSILVIGRVSCLEDPTAPGLKVDLFSSVSALKSLFNKERDFQHQLEDYISTLDNQVKALNDFLINYENLNLTKNEAKEYVSHPVNTYTMIKRLGIKWNDAKDQIVNQTAEEKFQKLVKTLDESLPSTDDMEGAANGIFLLHETYNLDLSKYTKGILEVPGSNKELIYSNTSLNVVDMENMGKLAFNRNYYDRANEWISEAIKQMESRSVLSPEAKQYLKKLVSISQTMMKKHDHVLVTKGPRGPDWRTYLKPFDAKLAKKKKYSKITDKKYRHNPVLSPTEQPHEIWEAFNALCRGELLRTPEMDKDLKCEHIHYNDPYLRLGPFKVEPLSLKPFISVFHDFMYEPEIQVYRSHVSSKLVRSAHGGGKPGVQKTSVKRTSSQNWLHYVSMTGDVLIKEGLAMSKRIKYATRMHALMEVDGEPYQVANYGIGGTYSQHPDSTGNFNRATKDNAVGDRIATAMVYLTEVNAGGATVFPNAGVTLWPKKGNMAFWFNNDSAGRSDPLTIHGGCPVLAGSKWITNKWIHSPSQMRNFPCPVTLGRMSQHRHKPLNNDLCKMLMQCDNVDDLDQFTTKETYLDYVNSVEGSEKLGKVGHIEYVQ